MRVSAYLLFLVDQSCLFQYVTQDHLLAITLAKLCAFPSVAARKLVPWPARVDCQPFAYLKP